MSRSLVVADEFCQVLWLLRRQRLECDQCNLVLDPKPHRQPVQIGEYRSNVITSAGVGDNSMASVFCRRCNLSMFADEVPHRTVFMYAVAIKHTSTVVADGLPDTM